MRLILQVTHRVIEIEKNLTTIQFQQSLLAKFYEYEQKKEEVIKWTEIYFQLIRSWKKDFSYKNFCFECCKMLWTKHPKPQMLLYYCVRQSKIKRKMSNAPWKTLSNPELSMHFDKKEWGYFENYILLVNVSSTHLSSLSV